MKKKLYYLYYGASYFCSIVTVYLLVSFLRHIGQTKNQWGLVFSIAMILIFLLFAILLRMTAIFIHHQLTTEKLLQLKMLEDASNSMVTLDTRIDLKQQVQSRLKAKLAQEK